MSPEEREALTRIVYGLRQGQLTNEQAIELLIQLGASAASPPPSNLVTRSTPDLSASGKSSAGPGKCDSTGFVAAGATYTIPNSMDATRPSTCTSTNTSAKETTCSNGSPGCVPGYYGILPNPADYANLSSSTRSRTAPSMSSRQANCSPTPTETSEFWANLDARMARLKSAGRSRSTPPPGRMEYMRAFNQGQSPNSFYGRMTPSYVSPGAPFPTPTSVEGSFIRRLDFSGLSGRETPSFMTPGRAQPRALQGSVIRKLNFTGISDPTINDPCPDLNVTNNVRPSGGNPNWSASEYASPQPDPCSPPQNGTFADVSGGSGYASFEYMGSDGSSIYGPESPSFFMPTPNASRAANMPMNSTHYRDAPPCSPSLANVAFNVSQAQSGGNATLNVPPGQSGGNATFNVPPGQSGGNATFNVPPGQSGGNATFNVPPGQNGGNGTYNVPQGQGYGNATFDVPQGQNAGNATFNVSQGQCGGGNATFDIPQGQNSGNATFDILQYENSAQGQNGNGTFDVPGGSSRRNVTFSPYSDPSTDQSGYASFEYMGPNNSSIYGSGYGYGSNFYIPSPGARMGGNVPMNYTRNARPCTPPASYGSFNIPEGQYPLGNATLTVGQGGLGSAIITTGGASANGSLAGPPPCVSNAGSLPPWSPSAISGYADAYEASRGQIIDLDLPYASTPNPRSPTPPPRSPTPSPRSPTPPPPVTPVNQIPSTPPGSVVSYLRPEDPYRCLRMASANCVRRLNFSDCVDSDGNPTP